MEPVSRFQAWRRDRNIPDNLKNTFDYFDDALLFGYGIYEFRKFL